MNFLVRRNWEDLNGDGGRVVLSILGEERNRALFQTFGKSFVFSTLGGHFGLWSVLPVVSLKCHHRLKLKKNLERVVFFNKSNNGD